MNPRPGEIWLADLGLAAKTRPVVIVSRFDPDAPRALIICVSVDNPEQRKSRYEVAIPKLRISWKAPSVANVQGIASIPSVRLERRLGMLPEKTLVDIRLALSFALDLDNSTK